MGDGVGYCADRWKAKHSQRIGHQGTARLCIPRLVYFKYCCVLWEANCEVPFTSSVEGAVRSALSPDIVMRHRQRLSRLDFASLRGNHRPSSFPADPAFRAAWSVRACEGWVCRGGTDRQVPVVQDASTVRYGVLHYLCCREYMRASSSASHLRVILARRCVRLHHVFWCTSRAGSCRADSDRLWAQSISRLH